MPGRFSLFSCLSTASRRRRCLSTLLDRKKGRESLLGPAANNPDQKTRRRREIEATDRQIDQLFMSSMG
jgi:hypothetical protein